MKGMIDAIPAISITDIKKIATNIKYRCFLSDEESKAKILLTTESIYIAFLEIIFFFLDTITCFYW
jgi:hypothetical protein